MPYESNSDLTTQFLLGSIIAVAGISCHYGIRKVGETVIGDILDNNTSHVLIIEG